MIISKDLFIFGEHIFGTIVPDNTGNATAISTTPSSSPVVTIEATQLQQQQQKHHHQHRHHDYIADNPGNNTINVSKPILSLSRSSSVLSTDEINKQILKNTTISASTATATTTTTSTTTTTTIAIAAEPSTTKFIKNQALSNQEDVTSTISTVIPVKNTITSPTKYFERITDNTFETAEGNKKFKKQLSDTSSSAFVTTPSLHRQIPPALLSLPTDKVSMEGSEDSNAPVGDSQDQYSNCLDSTTNNFKQREESSGNSRSHAVERSKLPFLQETYVTSQLIESDESSSGVVDLPSLSQEQQSFVESPLPPLKNQNICSSKRTKLHNNNNHRLHETDNVNCNGNSRNESVTVAMPFISETQRSLQLSFQNVTVLHSDRKILDDVSGVVSPGEILAVMGPSGSGKTTLLDCLSGQRRIDSGSICINRESLTKKWRRKICYVLQEEIFFSGLTLRETVMYTALLRLPEKIPKSEKVKLVDSILQSLELTFCQNTKFGDYMNRGLSGGEKKRANIACELLTNPLLMLLDEPTSGLDSYSAISLMKILKRYAIHEQKTVVITVHQPSSQMFHMFDKLLLLYDGCTAYFGEVYNIYRYFEDIGVTIQPHYNPAEFVLEQLKSNPDIREKLFVAARESHSNFLNRNCISQSGFISSNSTSRIDVNDTNCGKHDDVLINDILSNYYKDMNKSNTHRNMILASKRNNHPQEHDINHQHDESNRCEEATQQLWYSCGDSQSNFSSTSSDSRNYDWLDYPTRFTTQFCVLSSRNFKEAKSRMLSKLNWFQTIGLALMAGAIWSNVPRTEEYLHDLQGWMFFSQTYWMLFALFGALNSFPSEREVVNKERCSGSYRLSAYYLAKMVGELPLIVTLPTVYLMISYPMLGCPSIKLFFLMLIFLLLNTIVAQSVGFFIGACCMDMNVSITISALYTLATQLFGGYLSTRIPDFLSWIRYISIIHYAYQNMQILEFSEGLPIACSQPSSYEICKNNNTNFISSEEILKAQNSTLPLWLNTLVLMMFLLVFRVLGYTVLRYVRCPKT